MHNSQENLDEKLNGVTSVRVIEDSLSSDNSGVFYRPENSDGKNTYTESTIEITNPFPEQHVGPDNEVEYTYDISQLPSDSEVAKEAIENGGKFTYTRSEVKKLLRQYDKHILTFLCFLYFLSHLDRGNIGNAKVAGMNRDLGITSSQFSLVVSMFYVGYIVFQWGILLWKVIPPRMFAPWIIIGWGIVSTCCAVIKNWKQLLALRVVLGIFEACFSPGIYYYFSFFYHRSEIAKRVGIFQSFSPISSAVSGAIAFGITKHAPSGIEPWRLLFIVEGVPSVLGGLVAFYAIINGPESSRFLTQRQKNIAAVRTLEQAGSVHRGGRKLNFKEVYETLADFKIWANTAMFFCITLCQVPLPIFLPSIIEGMGYQGIYAQGLTAPPYLVAVAGILTTCYISDKYLQRAYPISVCLLIASVGYILLSVSRTTGVKYFGLYLAVPGVYSALSIIMTWTGDNQGSDTKRGVGYVVIHVIGMVGPIVGTFLFPSTEAPHYKKGIWVTTGIVMFCMLFSLVYRAYLVRENRKRDEKYGPVDKDEIRKCNDDTQKEYRYVV